VTVTEKESDNESMIKWKQQQWQPIEGRTDDDIEGNESNR
jgi:hypothetical protein